MLFHNVVSLVLVASASIVAFVSLFRNGQALRARALTSVCVLTALLTVGLLFGAIPWDSVVFGAIEGCICCVVALFGVRALEYKGRLDPNARQFTGLAILSLVLVSATAFGIIAPYMEPLRVGYRGLALAHTATAIVMFGVLRIGEVMRLEHDPLFDTALLWLGILQVPSIFYCALWDIQPACIPSAALIGGFVEAIAFIKIAMSSTRSTPPRAPWRTGTWRPRHA